MSTTPETNVAPASFITPSLEKYGAIVLQYGFTQHPRSVEDYLQSLRLHPTEILLIQVLESYRREAGQEVFPGIRTLAGRIGRSTRTVNTIIARLVSLGLICRTSRFEKRSQTTNGYSLDPLYQQVAAWLNPEVAAELAEQEVENAQPFLPTDVIDETAQILCEEFGEPTPTAMRGCARRLRLRWEKFARAQEWETFTDLIERAASQTETRKAEPTNTGKPFTQLMHYFFSALDYLISRQQTRAQASRQTYPFNPPASAPPFAEQQEQISRPPEPPLHTRTPKSGELAKRQAARRIAEKQGQPKPRGTATLLSRIQALSQQFHDEQAKSSLQRAANLMHDAQLDETTMCELVQQAREITSQHQINKRNKNGQFNRMAYFFGVLEEQIGDLVERQVQ